MKLEKLNYEYSKFDSVIDKETMEIHHSKHLNAYITNYNAAVEGTNFADNTVEENIININKIDDSIRQAVINNGGGILNHVLYFDQFEENVSLKDGEFSELIISTFGSLENLKEELKTAGLKRFGSGWSWLVLKDGKLEVISTANQDSPLMEGYTPLLGIDVWEHAYYLKYQNRRPDYLTSVLTIINWDIIENRFNLSK